MARCEEGWRQAIDGDLVFGAQIHHPLEVIERGWAIPTLHLRVTADVVHTVTLEELKPLVVSGCALATQLHLGGRGGLGGSGTGRGRQSTGRRGGVEEVASIHCGHHCITLEQSAGERRELGLRT